MSGRLAVAKQAEAAASFGDYFALTKPRVTAMMLYTTAIGYWLGWPAEAGSPDWRGCCARWPARRWWAAAPWR